MVVRDNMQYIITNGELHLYIIYILYLIKYSFEYLFGAFLIFVIANLLPPSLHPLLMIVIMKPPGGKSFGLRDTNVHLTFL